VITHDKNHIPPPRKPHGFSRQSYRSLTGKRQRHSERITCRRPLQWPQPMWFLNVWDNVPLDLKYVCQQYFTCMCFLGFIRYNKTFIACEFRKYENLFTHEYYIPLGRCPQGIWYSWARIYIVGLYKSLSWVNTFSYFPHQLHAINEYYPTAVDAFLCLLYKPVLAVLR